MTRYNSEYTGAEIDAGITKILKPYKPFTTRWRLDDTDKTINLPLPVAGEYDFVVDWGDGTTGIVTAYNDAAVSHTYTTAGIKTVSIMGKMTHWSFNNGGDKLKITDVLRGGYSGLTSLYGGFYGCSNLKFVANDSAWTKDVTDMHSMFYSCSVFNSDISAWDVSSVEDMNHMFYACSVFNSDISAWDVSSVTDMTNMLNGANVFSTANYNLLLNAWSSLTLKPNVHFHAGDAKYTIETSQTAHDTLTTPPNSWSITDGGGIE